MSIYSHFTKITLDADPFGPDFITPIYYEPNNFFRVVRNFVIDIRRRAPSLTAKAVHWPVAQGTSLSNVVIWMAAGDDSKHQGIFIDGGRYVMPF